MKNEAAVHKVETEGNLHEPVEDLALGEQSLPVTGVEVGGLIEPRRHLITVSLLCPIFSTLCGPRIGTVRRPQILLVVC